MPRVTRSQLEAIEHPSQQPTPLAELNVSMGTNRVDDDALASELKGLKAAYRGALGIAKRGKKSRSKRKDKQDSLAETLEILDGHTVSDSLVESPLPEATRQLLKSRQGSLRSLLGNHVQRGLIESTEKIPFFEQESQPLAPIGRTTRRQAAKAQAGQYDSPDIFIPKQDSSALAQKLRDLDYISLFAGRYTRAPRDQRVFLPNRVQPYTYFGTDHNEILAEEALSKSTSQNISETQVEHEEETAQATLEEKQSSEVLAAVSPAKTLAEVEQVYGSVESPAPAYDTEDSFLEQIISRSPAKPVSRIEDSLEALDQLEEALEAIGEVALAERLPPPEKVRDKSHTLMTRPASLERSKSLRAAKPEANVNGLRKVNSVRGETSKPGYGSMRVKPTAPKSTSVLKKATSMTFNSANTERKRIEEPSRSQPMSKAPAKRPISLLPPKETVKSAKPLTRPTFELPGEAVARRLKEQREARLAQRSSSEDSSQNARVVSDNRCKSTKPPTKAAFELPGEALSRRKREAHEARLKAQEEEERQRREFKAKPIRKSVIPDYVPRETAASRARQSRVGLENMDGGEVTVSKRTPSSGANVSAHRTSVVLSSQANVSAPRAKAPLPVRKPSPTTHGPSMSGRALQRTVTANDVQVQRQRAKEIYERDARMTEDMGRERREREAAAKRAREEAAERGRQASREWAEKQMARKVAENDTMGPGYGPGGQLGLRG